MLADTIPAAAADAPVAATTAARAPSHGTAGTEQSQEKCAAVFRPSIASANNHPPVTNDGHSIGDIVGFARPDLVFAPSARDVPALPMRSPDPAQWRLAEVGARYRAHLLDSPRFALVRLGFESFRPLVAPGKRWGPKGKVSKRRTAPFAGWMFVNLRREDIALAMSAHLGGSPALRRIVDEPDFNCVIPGAEIEALRREWEAGGFDEVLPADALPDLAPGAPARVRRGQFQGFAAMVKAVMGDRAKVLVGIFGREALVELPLADLEEAE